MALKGARNRVLDENKQVALKEFADEWGWAPGSRLAAVPIGRGVYIAKLPPGVRLRKGGQVETDQLLIHAIRSMMK